MKNLKRIVKTTCIISSILFLSGKINAQNYITIANNGIYYLCQGTTTYLTWTPDSATYNIVGIGDWYFQDQSHYCSSFSCSEYGLNISNIAGYGGYTYNRMTISSNLINTSSGYVSVYLFEQKGSSNHLREITFTLYTYTTSVTGATHFCQTSNENYSAVTNLTPITSYSWVPASGIVSGTSGTGTDVTSTIGSGSGTMSVNITSAACPSTDPSCNGTLYITSYPSTKLATPSGFGFRQDGNSCQFNGIVSTITNAEYYDWSSSSTNFTSPYLYETTTSPITTMGEFDYGTAYTVYVRARNECSVATSNVAPFMHTTPGKPAGCQQGPIKPPSPAEGYKVYPNPANNLVTIEYPGSYTNAGLSLSMYDMLGHKMASWNLPSSENSVSEDTSVLPTGLYLYVISADDNIVFRGKLMIQR